MLIGAPKRRAQTSEMGHKATFEGGPVLARSGHSQTIDVGQVPKPEVTLVIRSFCRRARHVRPVSRGRAPSRSFGRFQQKLVQLLQSF
jgi:hypothetical protein